MGVRMALGADHVAILRLVLGQGSVLALVEPQLFPSHSAVLHGVPQSPLALRQIGGRPGLDFDEDDFLERVLIQPIEHDEVHWGSEEAYVLRVVREISEPWREMLAHFAGNDGAAALDGVATDIGLGVRTPGNRRRGSGTRARRRSRWHACTTSGVLQPTSFPLRDPDPIARLSRTQVGFELYRRPPTRQRRSDPFDSD